MRIGIHTGFCTVGNFGCDARLDYTVIGGTVNLASRLESMAGPDEILISAETHALVREEFPCARLSGVTVKGWPHPLDLYRVADRDGAWRGAMEFVGSGVHVQLDGETLRHEGAARVLREALVAVERQRARRAAADEPVRPRR